MMKKVIFVGIFSLWCSGVVYSQGNGPLILTPLLDAGEHIQAQEQSRVNFATFGDVESYAAYFQVAAENNSNIFFWFFPSRNNSVTDPVMLCLQGGPGVSSLFTLFTESGPFEISDGGDITNRVHSWTEFSSVLYIDSPLDVGFSFTDLGTEATNLGTIAFHLIQSVVQFFKLFPDLRSNEFFIWGESYGGKYVPALAYLIKEYNARFDDDINLKGVCIGNGLTDPGHQVGYGEYLYQIGLIDDETKVSIEQLEVTMVEQVGNGDHAGGLNTFMEILKTFSTSSGYNDVYNYLSTTYLVNDQEAALNTFLNLAEVQEALHVGNLPYIVYNGSVANYLTDYFEPVPQLIEDLLNNDFKVLIYNGQLDIMIPHVTVVNYLRELEFPGSDDFRVARKQIWKVGGDVGGYVRNGGNLYEVLVRNAGHNAPRDQPAFVSDLLQRFIFNRPMWG